MPCKTKIGHTLNLKIIHIVNNYVRIILTKFDGDSVFAFCVIVVLANWNFPLVRVNQKYSEIAIFAISFTGSRMS